MFNHGRNVYFYLDLTEGGGELIATIRFPSENLSGDSRKLRPPTKKLQAARVRLSSDSRLLPDDFTHALSSSADRRAW